MCDLNPLTKFNFFTESMTLYQRLALKDLRLYSYGNQRFNGAKRAFS